MPEGIAIIAGAVPGDHSTLWSCIEKVYHADGSSDCDRRLRGPKEEEVQES